MKRLVTMAACLAMLTFTGCANGLLGGGLFGNGCNSRPGLFQGNGFLSDGPVRQFLRGDACDSCNSAAGQIAPASAATCDACGSSVPTDPYAPVAAPIQQPVTSFYPSDSGVMLGQPMLQNQGLAPLETIQPSANESFGAIDGAMSDPPTGIQ